MHVFLVSSAVFLAMRSMREREICQSSLEACRLAEISLWITCEWLGRRKRNEKLISDWKTSLDLFELGRWDFKSLVIRNPSFSVRKKHTWIKIFFSSSPRFSFWVGNYAIFDGGTLRRVGIRMRKLRWKGSPAFNESKKELPRSWDKGQISGRKEGTKLSPQSET